eukprot:gene9041-10677_t
MRGVQRTHRPTKFPTSQPTSRPSSLPTSTPTLTTVSQWEYRLSELVDTFKDTQRGSVYSSFGELLLNDNIIVGGTTDFYGFLSGELATASQFNQVKAVRLFATSSLTEPFQNYTCASPSAAAFIVARLANSRNYDNVYLPTNMTCGGNRWAIHNCPTYASVKMCVNCFDPCILGTVNDAAVFPFNCQTNGGCLQALQVYSVEPFPPATIDDVNVHDVAKTALQLTITASDACFVYCKAYSLAMVPRTVEEVIVLNNVNYTVNNEVNLAFSGLSPATNYSIYCVTKSLSGSTSTAVEMLRSAIPVRTACCKSIAINLVETSYSAGYKRANAVQVIVYDAPAMSVKLSLSHQVAAGFDPSLDQSLFQCLFSPVLTVLNQSAVGTAAPHTLAVQCGANIPTGSYAVNVALDGFSSEEYTVSFIGTSTFRILDSTVEINTAPAMSSARFSSDGGFVIVSFNTPTNKALLADAFPCTALFSFPGIGSAQCLWTDAKTIRIAVFGTNKLAINDIIRLNTASSSSISKLRVQCPDNIVCKNALAINPAGVVTVQGPVLPVQPLVIISGPTSIGQCQTLSLDFSSSSGSAGKDWQSVRVLVTSTRNDNTTAIEQDVAKKVRLSPQITLPAFSFQGDRVYTMFTTLCNFLGACGSGRYAVRVTNSSAPVVNIFSPIVTSLKPSDALVLDASVANTDCASSADTTSISALTLEWSVLQNNVQVSRLVSSSVDPLKFFLGAYLLTVGEQYQIRLTATHRRTLLSSQSTVTVLITPTNLVATIAGGASRTISATKPFTLDAARSYDSNLSPTARYNDIMLRFQWTCQIAGVSNSSIPCPFRFDSSIRSSASISITPVGQLSVDSSYIMSLSLTKDSRLSQTSILLVPQVSDACSVGLVSPYTSAINVNQKVKFTATVRASVLSTLMWSFNDNSQLNMSAIALGPTTSHLVPPNVNIPSAFAANIAIRPNAFVAGASYTLSLSCLQVVSGRRIAVASSSVTIVMNAPPTAGTLEVSPAHGVAIRDLFTFSALNWVDSELPLTYQFGFAAPTSETILTLRSQSVISYGQSILPAGQLNAGRNLTVVVTVFDALAANVTAAQRVRVSEAETNGYDISATLAAVRNMRRLQTVTCTTSASCGAFESCVGGLCQAVNKTCVNNCFDHGQCIWMSRNTGLQVQTCPVADYSCNPTCVCNTGYFGASCSRTTLAQQSRVSARRALLSSLSELLIAEYPQQETITSWIGMLTSIVQVNDELSNESGQELVTVLQKIMAAAQAGAAPAEVVQGLSLSIGSIPTYLKPSQATSVAAYQAYFENVMRTVLQQYCELLASDLTVQQQVLTIEPTFRVVTSSFYIRDGTSITAPLLPIEQTADVWTPQSYSFQPSLEVAGLTDSVALSLVVLRSSDFPGSSFNSNPVRLFFHSSTSSRFFSSANTDKINVVLQNIEDVDILKRATTNYTTECFNRRPVNRSYACPGGFPDLVVSCTGSAGSIFSRCPFYFHESICSTTARTADVDSPRCERVSYDAMTTVCACSWPAVFSPNRRYLLDTLSSSDVALTSNVAFRYFTFDGKFTPAVPPLTADKIFTAPAAMATVGGMIILLIVLVLWTDHREWDLSTWSLLQKKKEKEIEEHDDIVSTHYPGAHPHRNAETGYTSAKWFGVMGSFSSRNWTVDEELGASGAAPPLKYVLKNAVPAVFQVQNFFVSLYRELKTHHRVFSLIVNYCTFYTRLARLASIATHINLFLLSNYLIITFVYSAGRDCYKHLYEDQCLAKGSMFDPGESQCQWDSFYNTCDNHVPETSTFSVIVVACLAQLMCVPFHLTLEFAIRKLSDCVIETGGSAALSARNLDIARYVTQSSKRSGFNFGSNKIAPVPRSVRFNTTTQELVELERGVVQALRGMDQHSQDLLLGNIDRFLSKRNGFKVWHEAKALTANSAVAPDTGLSTPCAPSRFKTERFHKVAAQLVAQLKQEYTYVEHLDEKSRSSHMFLLFVLDLLPTVTARIVADKAERDRPRPWTLTFWQTVAAWAFLAAINVAVFVMCVLLTLELNNAKQTLWVNSFVFWLCLEPFVVNVLFVLIAHMFLPSLVVKSLRVAKVEIGRIVDRYILDNRKRESKLNPRGAISTNTSPGFDFAPYFFLSTKVAKLFPTYRESRLIQSYRTDQSFYGSLLKLPLEDTPNGGAEAHWWLLRWFSRLTILTQDVMIYFFATVFAGLLCLLHVKLYHILPPLLAVPSGLALIILTAVLVRNFKQKLNDVGNTADLTLTVHDNHLHVVDLVDTSKSDIMQSKFFKQDGVDDMLAPAMGQEAQYEYGNEQKMSEAAEELSLHVIDNENELVYDQARRHNNIMEYRRQQKEREDEELRRRAEEEGPRSEAGMEMKFQNSASVQSLSQRTPIPVVVKPDMAKVAAQASITNQVKDKLSAISERIKSAKLTPIKTAALHHPIHDMDYEEEKESSWLPSRVNLSEMNESDDSDDAKDDGSLRAAEGTRVTADLASRMQTLRVAPGARAITPRKRSTMETKPPVEEPMATTPASVQASVPVKKSLHPKSGTGKAAHMAVPTTPVRPVINRFKSKVIPVTPKNSEKVPSFTPQIQLKMPPVAGRQSRATPKTAPRRVSRVPSHESSSSSGSSSSNSGSSSTSSSSNGNRSGGSSSSSSSSGSNSGSSGSDSSSTSSSGSSSDSD